MRALPFFLIFALCEIVPLSAAEVDFAHEIVPLLKQQCAKCHAGTQKKGGFSFNSRESLLEGGESGTVIAVGKSGESDLVSRIVSHDSSVRMPPEGEALNEKQIALIKRWVDTGLNWEPGFTFGTRAYDPPLKLQKVELPPAASSRPHPVDRLLDAYCKKNSLPVPQPIDDAAFARRAYLDLIGLLPTPDELSKFLGDPNPEKRARLIHALLHRDGDYAEHWLTFWNDLLRNDYSGTGFITGGRKQVSKWLYASLATNKPYDQMVRELIAPPNEDSAGFEEGIRWRGEVSAGQTVEIQFAQSTSQAFLGINLKCASCHDSFVDKWTLDDSYGLAAVYSNRPLELHRCDKPTGKMAQAAWLFHSQGTINPKAPQAERLKQMAILMTAPENGRFSRTIVNRLWQRLMGRGVVHPIDAMQMEPWNAELLEYLAAQHIQNKYDLKKTLELIATSQAYQSQAETVATAAEGAKYIYHGPRAKRMTAEQFVDAVWQLTGSAPKKSEAPVVRANQSKKRMVRASLMKSDFLMRSLGRPNRDQIVSVRPAELSTLEAIDLSNGETLAASLRTGATNIMKRKFDSVDAFTRWLYRSALSRDPTNDELQAVRGTMPHGLTQPSIEDSLWSVVMLPEFMLVR